MALYVELSGSRRESFVHPLAQTAELTISDWKGEEEPDGPIVQQTAFNFVEVQPFLMD